MRKEREEKAVTEIKVSKVSTGWIERLWAANAEIRRALALTETIVGPPEHDLCKTETEKEDECYAGQLNNRLIIAEDNVRTLIEQLKRIVDKFEYQEPALTCADKEAV